MPLACRTLTGDRCAAVAVVSGRGSRDATGLDPLAGMGKGHQDEFRAALSEEARLRDLLLPRRAEMVSAGHRGHNRRHAECAEPPRPRSLHRICGRASVTHCVTIGTAHAGRYTAMMPSR
jgi:hypothetical protein